MARNETSRLKITIDIDKATGKILQFNQTLGNTERKVQQTGQAMGRMATQTTQAGQSAAASAVNFQTMSMGMLNLSTSAVQTFTSISNLDRAVNRHKMSVIAVARAEDLLAAKQERLTQLERAGHGATQKAINLKRELATATADLTVKKEKESIEQGAVNDVYMLFAANIANVVISSMQTIAVMDKNQIILTKVKTVGQKIHNLSMFTSAKAAYASAAGNAADALAKKGAIGATVGLTVAVKGLTAATKAFMASNPILLGAMIASTAAFIAYEANVLGMKDAVNSMIGVEEDFESQVHDTRAAIEAETAAINELTDSADKNSNDALPFMIAMQESYMRQVQGTTTAIKEQIQANKDLGASKQGFSTPSALTAGGMGVGTGTPSGYQSGTTVDSTAITSATPPVNKSNFNLIPQAFGATPRGTLKTTAEEAEVSTPVTSTLSQFGSFGTFGKVVDEFEKNKQSMKSQIENLQQKANNRTITDSEISELSKLNVQYLNNFHNRTIDRFTGKTITSSGIPQSQQLEDWSKNLSFKYKPTENLREAAGYTIPEKEKKKKESPFVQMYQQGGSQKHLVETLMKGRFKQDYDSFDFGTNVGYGVPFYNEDGTIDQNALLGRGSMIRGLNVGTKGMNDDLAKMLGLKTEREQVAEHRFKEASEKAAAILAQQRFGQTRSIEGITGQGGQSSFAVVDGKVENYVSSRARQAMAAAQALGRATWHKEQAKDSAFQTGGENVRYWVERVTGGQLSTEDVAAINSLQSSHNEQVKAEADRAFDTGKKVNLVWLRIQTQNNAKALGQSIANRIAQERATALEFGNQLGISQNEALQILRDKSQGEQTLNDMLAFQQRLDAMSSGVV
jgi:hypothetical protein